MDVQYRSPSPHPAPTPAHPALSPSADDSPQRVAHSAPPHSGSALGHAIQRDPVIAAALEATRSTGQVSGAMLEALLDLAEMADSLASALIHREIMKPRVSGEPVALMDRSIGQGLDALRQAAGGAA